MAVGHEVRLLIAAVLAAAACLGGSADAQEGRPGSGAAPVPGSSGPASPDRALLDAMVKDLDLSLSRPGESTSLRVPLTPSEWTLSGLRPYAAFNPRVLKPVTDGPTGLAAPERESVEDLSHGVGVGAGLRWRLSDRLDLFGEYLFPALPASSAPTSSPALRPDAEAPAGLKGGFSIRF